MFHIGENEGERNIQMKHAYWTSEKMHEEKKQKKHNIGKCRMNADNNNNNN